MTISSRKAARTAGRQARTTWPTSAGSMANLRLGFDGHQPLRKTARCLGRLANALQTLKQVVATSVLLFEQESVAENWGQEAVEIVGDARGDGRGGVHAHGAPRR